MDPHSKCRHFSGLIGLNIESNNFTSHRDDVLNLVKTWQSHHTSINLPVIVGNVETLVYIQDSKIVEEPVVRLYGEIAGYTKNVTNTKLTDDTILETLIKLFEFLRVGLSQKSIRFSYQGYEECHSYRLA
jgi:hypothetical protein